MSDPISNSTTNPNAIPIGWVETTLGEVCEVQNGYAFKADEFSNSGMYVIKIKNIASGEFILNDIGLYNGDISKLSNYLVEKGDILVSMTGSHISQISSAVGKVAIYNAEEKALLNQRVGNIKPKTGIDKKYLQYLVIQPQVQLFWGVKAGGSANQANISPNVIKSYSFLLPPLPEQQAIASVLSAFDDKIELLREQNKTLEELGQTIFNEWFCKYKVGDELPEGWRVGKLSEIAVFLNGVALQRFPAENEFDYLPVIKIRELKAGITSQTDKANKKIDSKYIIDYGDVLFSWSGSLEVVIWQFGKGALNQHLFKVSSQKYPKWFYYFWTLYHLQDFREIASHKATTMGHIQRHHLDQAEVLIPSDKTLHEIDNLISPILEKIMLTNQQIQTLAQTRDELLPRLMRGEVRVSI